jgi:hypothetical protein
VNAREAQAVLALLHHLDGSQIVEADDLMKDADVLYLGASLHGPHVSVDADTLFDTLAEVGQRHCDAGR